MIQLLFPAPWVSTFTQSISKELETEPFVSFQFATVDKNLSPKVRTVVFRDFLFGNEKTNVLTFVTDKRMAKFEELIHNDKFEAVFYFKNCKRQFRFNGVAKLLNDEYAPRIDLSFFLNQPTIIDEHEHEDDDEDGEEDDEDDGIILNSSMSHHLRDSKGSRSMNHNSSHSHSSSHNHGRNHARHSNHSHKHEAENKQKAAINYPIISPSILSSLTAQELSSHTNLRELSTRIKQPTETEWKEEVERQWSKISGNLKSSFRKPHPKSELTEENAKKIDSIKRGVDGKNVNVGLDNFAVVCLFVNFVDFVDLNVDKRVLYTRDFDYEQWNENDVCP